MKSTELGTFRTRKLTYRPLTINVNIQKFFIEIRGNMTKFFQHFELNHQSSLKGDV